MHQLKYEDEKFLHNGKFGRKVKNERGETI